MVKKNLLIYKEHRSTILYGRESRIIGKNERKNLRHLKYDVIKEY